MLDEADGADAAPSRVYSSPC